MNGLLKRVRKNLRNNPLIWGLPILGITYGVGVSIYSAGVGDPIPWMTILAFGILCSVLTVVALIFS